jgi:23S rRNA (adenine2030-N6)-methyltransferase
MLSYRHAFHSGNHADVLKHLVLVQLTRYLCQKEQAFWYLDTHAGAGSYALDSAAAAKLGEFRDGVGRLWGRKDLPAALADYMALVRKVNPDGSLKVYPGSPMLALAIMRAQDRLRLFELHSREVIRLRENFQAFGKQAIVHDSDGFASLKALLPPPPRRAVVLIDPPYEERRDYDRVVNSLRECLTRFPTGTYMLWYPQLTKLEAHDLPQRLQRLSASNWLQVDEPSRRALMMGMPPATAASKATMTPFFWAAAKISLPCTASRALLAVTTCLPWSMAAMTRSLATV